MFIAVLVFILILGVLVLAHELGHFVTARRNGVEASEFGFGFPPRIVGIQFLRKENSKKYSKWRIIWGSKDGDNLIEKVDLKDAHEKRMRGGTIYSLNWIPLGGFVKIKGEDGGSLDEKDSFSTKSAWIRIKILVAGVVMNFVLAWFLFSASFFIGAPEQIDSSQKSNADAKIQVSEIVSGSPASEMGIKVGDEIAKKQKNNNGEIVYFKNIKDVQNFINNSKGHEMALNILRGSEQLILNGVPRVDAPKDQGALGIALAETALVRYPLHIALVKGLVSVWDMTTLIFLGLYQMLVALFSGHGGAVDVSGPVGIAVLTKEVTGLGMVYVIQFAAMLSINLGIINALPIPALDGGRILFVLIEKIKGSPVSVKVEQSFHLVFFALLILLMVVVTYKDIVRFF
jgi:regulator of sigma E protease